MRKAIMEKFILVLLAALCFNSVIFYLASSTMILRTSRRDMTYTIKALDSILEYDKDILSQMNKLEAFTAQDSSRVTLMQTDGTVIADSDAPVEKLDNHLDREDCLGARGGICQEVFQDSPQNDALCRLPIRKGRYGTQASCALFWNQPISAHAASVGADKLSGCHGLLHRGFPPLCFLSDPASAPYFQADAGCKGGLYPALL